MFGWLAILGNWFTPPDEAWWTSWLAWLTLAGLVGALLLAVWPRALPGPLTPGEIWAARRRGFGRLAPLAPPAAWALASLVAAALLCLGPRRPEALVYQSPRVA